MKSLGSKNGKILPKTTKVFYTNSDNTIVRKGSTIERWLRKTIGANVFRLCLPVAEYLNTSVRLLWRRKMNRKNMRKTAPRSKDGYLITKERKILEWYESKRIEAKLRELELNGVK
jgi:hypothetical protein